MVGGLTFGVLGPLSVARDGVEIVVPRRRQRLVLVRLLIDAGEVVPAERLVREIWGATAPETGTGPLRTNVWELRRLLGTAAHEVIVSRRRGYAVVTGRDQLDSARFEDLLTEAAAAAAADDPLRGLYGVEAAVGLWRGPAFGELAGEPALMAESARLDQLHLGAHELRARLLLDLGRHDQVAAELGEVVRANPERERLWASLMTALYRCGRQGDALRCYQEARSSLVEAIGVEPGPELHQLEHAILQHDPKLDWRPPSVAGDRELPPCRASDAVPAMSTPAGHNLPTPLTDLVGRAEERAAVADALVRTRLLSLVGPGGCGKTRLAVAVAGDVLGHFGGGVWFVDLSGVSSQEPVARVVAAALGADAGRVAAGGPPASSPPDEGETLLVLDNCEHLVGPVADYVADVLNRVPRLRVLATTREALRLPGEVVWRVTGLPLPVLSSSAATGDSAAFLGSEAVELFVRRGAAALSGFAPGRDALEVVAKVCRRLDGLPLAIELTASLVGTLPLAEIARRVDERCAMVPEARQRGTPRHRTITATIDWSFDLLSSSTQELFIRLGVFAGSFTLRAVRAVVDEPVGSDTSDALCELARASLLEHVAGDDGVVRYRMLETVREYAVDRIETRDDAAELRAAHGHYFAAWAGEVDGGMRGPASRTWRAEAETELPNLRAALRWAMANDDVEVAVGLATSLRWFLPRLVPPDDLARWLEPWEDRAELAPDLRVSLLTTSGMVALLRSDHDRAGRVGREAAILARQLGQDHHLAVALIASGAAALSSGDLVRGDRELDESRLLCESVGDRWGLGWVLVGQAASSLVSGRADEARHRMVEALSIFRELGDLHSQVVPLGGLALHALDVGEPNRAIELASDALRLAAAVDLDEARHATLATLGLAELTVGRLAAARVLFLASLRCRRPSQRGPFVQFTLQGLAMLAAAAGRFDEALKLFGLAEQVLQPPRTLAPKMTATVDEILASLRRLLGTRRAEQQLQHGRQLPLDTAVTIAETATSTLADVRTDDPAEGSSRTHRHLRQLNGPIVVDQPSG